MRRFRNRQRRWAVSSSRKSKTDVLEWIATLIDVPPSHSATRASAISPKPRRITDATARQSAEPRRIRGPIRKTNGAGNFSMDVATACELTRLFGEAEFIRGKQATREEIAAALKRNLNGG